MTFLVILHTAQGDVRTRYPRHKQAQAIAHWQDYAGHRQESQPDHRLIDTPRSSGLSSGS
ncbi:MULTISPECIES: hypothetical protein [Pseudomonas syringae group]|uniref:Uncharacterized protein n=1 Tax=Pseudomonas syringae pv. persicae TaxID=237306 RepID=A0AB38EMA2_9PSED|nr:MULTISPECIES: hypothetical protein [Pseudomonas syringae group]SOQ15833.1 hypothetical protein NCPPB2254_05660 [Pseudomonas syringae pv. persicae]SOQ16271.1 hypothetical protein CFBP1573P_05988 [Pseudomonas syringae pv. persicae]